ncbi:MAG: hypothetical protein HY879_28230 [Deltaproteobacteria bacterium]|nr:hypothetical protein [Deltaproteobacteria bacterium]
MGWKRGVVPNRTESGMTSFYISMKSWTYPFSKHLFISRFTVETHLKNIFDKAGIRHRSGLANLLQSI